MAWAVLLPLFSTVFNVIVSDQPEGSHDKRLSAEHDYEEFMRYLVTFNLICFIWKASACELFPLTASSVLLTAHLFHIGWHSVMIDVVNVSCIMFSQLLQGPYNFLGMILCDHRHLTSRRHDDDLSDTFADFS